MDGYHSQEGQDRYLEDNVFKGFKNGTFVDVGAHNGVLFNNTLFFEKQHDWNGINIEPIPTVYDSLVLNRPNCTNINCAVFRSEGTSDFICNTGYCQMLSGLSSEYDDHHHAWVKREREEQQHGPVTTEVIKVPTKRLDAICREHNITHINYLSIDVEGGEKAVIESINFSEITIDVIGFEDNYHSDNTRWIINYLQDNGFVRLKDYGNAPTLDIFMIHKDSKFFNQ